MNRLYKQTKNKHLEPSTITGTLRKNMLKHLRRFSKGCCVNSVDVKVDVNFVILFENYEILKSLLHTHRIVVFIERFVKF